MLRELAAACDEFDRGAINDTAFMLLIAEILNKRATGPTSKEDAAMLYEILGSDVWGPLP